MSLLCARLRAGVKRGGSVEDLMLALVAQRYYLEDRSKVQIAD